MILVSSDSMTFSLFGHFCFIGLTSDSHRTYIGVVPQWCSAFPLNDDAKIQHFGAFCK